jgi:hypothetical protein
VLGHGLSCPDVDGTGVAGVEVLDQQRVKTLTAPDENRDVTVAGARVR